MLDLKLATWQQAPAQVHAAVSHMHAGDVLRHAVAMQHALPHTSQAAARPGTLTTAATLEQTSMMHILHSIRTP